MSRSGYSEDCDGGALQLWRGAVQKSITGKRGQRLLRDIADAMDAMPDKQLVADELVSADGDFCTLGVAGLARGVVEKLKQIDTDDRETIAKLLDVAPSLVAEISFENDNPFGYHSNETPERRWSRMRAWVAAQIKTTGAQP